MFEGPVNVILRQCIDKHVAEKPSKRAKTNGAAGLMADQIGAVTPRLSKQEVGANKKNCSFETYAKHRSFMELLAEQNVTEFTKIFDSLTRYAAMLAYKL